MKNKWRKHRVVIAVTVIKVDKVIYMLEYSMEKNHDLARLD